MFLSLGVLAACQSMSGSNCALDSCAKIPVITAETFSAHTMGSCTDKSMGKYVLIQSDGTDNNTICGKTLDCYRVDYLKYTVTYLDCAQGGEYSLFTLKQ